MKFPVLERALSLSWKWWASCALAASGAFFLMNCSVKVMGGSLAGDAGSTDTRNGAPGSDPGPGHNLGPGPDPGPNPEPPGETGRTIWGVDDANQLIRFSTTSPGDVTVTPITPLGEGEKVQGVDFRPNRGVLYAFTSIISSAKVYTIVQDTGVATPVNGDAGVATYPVLLNTTATSYGVDFDPKEDRLRITSNDGLGLRIHPENGRSVNPTSDQPPTFSDGGVANIVGTAFTNSLYVKPKTTTLYAIDSNRNALVIFQGNPSEGNVKIVGPLGVDPSEVAGFDIVGGTDGLDGGVTQPVEAYAALTIGTTTDLYRVDLKSGTATAIGAIGHTRPLRGITIVTDRPQD